MKFMNLLLVAMLSLISFCVEAQTETDKLFSKDNKNIIYLNKPKKYTGEPLVFIEGISDQAQPEGWMDELKIQLFGSMELPKDEIQKPLPPLESVNNEELNTVKVTPFFGEEKNVLFVPHTEDWYFLIQVLNEQEIQVEENVQFITTQETTLLERDWPIDNKHFIPREARLNGKTIPFSLNFDDSGVSFKLPPLVAGIHRLKLSYILKNQGTFSSQKASFNIPLTGTKWGLDSGSFFGVILFPVKTEIKESEFLLGKNKLKIPEAFNVQADKDGTFFFKSAHILPAFTQTELNFSMTFKEFIKKDFWEKFWDDSALIIFLIALLVIVAYLGLSALEIKMASNEELLHHKKFQSEKQFIQRILEITIGTILLLILTLGILFLKKVSLSILQWGVLIFIPAIIIILIDAFVFKPKQKEILLLREKLLQRKADK